MAAHTYEDGDEDEGKGEGDDRGNGEGEAFRVWRPGSYLREHILNARHHALQAAEVDVSTAVKTFEELVSVLGHLSEKGEGEGEGEGCGARVLVRCLL